MIQQLVCPCCGEASLHQIRVKTFSRCEGDDRTAVAVIEHRTGSTLTITQADLLNQNPSPHRQGATIVFECERGCHEESPLTLEIYQHKGSTMVGWSFYPEALEFV